MLFVITGLLWATDSLLAAAGGGSRDQPAPGDWPSVFPFSAAIVFLAVALPAFLG